MEMKQRAGGQHRSRLGGRKSRVSGWVWQEPRVYEESSRAIGAAIRAEPPLSSYLRL